MPYSGTPEEIRAKLRAKYLRNRDKILANQKARDAARKASMTPEEMAVFKAQKREASSRYEHKHRPKRIARKKTPAYRAMAASGMRILRAKDPEKTRAKAQATYHADPKRAIAYVRKWAKNHPAQIQVGNQRYRAMKNAAPRNDLTHQQWLDIQAAQDHCCAYCGERCKGRLSQDHITPLSKGGSHTLHNVIGACQSCNSRKGNRAILVPVQPLLL